MCMSKPTVYMAGPIQHAADRGKGWRNRVKQGDECEWVDPFDKYDSTTEEGAEWSDEDIVENDLEMIDNSDALLVHWPRHRSERVEYPTNSEKRTCVECGGSYDMVAKHYNMSDCQLPQPSEKEKEAIKGMVMSDGHIGNRDRTPRLDVQMINPSALEEFAEEIPSFHPKVWDTGKTTDADNKIFRLCTISHPWLEEVAQSYESGKKQYPENLELTPTMAKWWYVGDGSLIWKDAAQHGYVQIACQNEKENTEKLENILSDFSPTVHTYGDCCLDTENSKKFLQYIGDPVPGMRYKWEINSMHMYQKQKPFTQVSSVGTPMEVRYAYEHGLPIVLQTTVPFDRLSPWVTYHADSVSRSFDHAINAILFRTEDV